MTHWLNPPTLLLSMWSQAAGMVTMAFVLAWFVSWFDGRVLARIEGRRRRRNGLLGSLARAVADMVRVRSPTLWPTMVAALSVLPALLLVAGMLHVVFALAFGAQMLATTVPGLLWWLAALLGAAAANRWILTCVWVGSRDLGRRRLLSGLTPWFGLWVALFITLVGVGLVPATFHPVATLVLIAMAGLWRRLEAQMHPPGISVDAGAAAQILAAMASHLVVTALILAAAAVSGLSQLLPTEPMPLTPGSLAAALLLVVAAGVFLSRVCAVVLFSDPTPQRLRRFAWGGLLPLAGVEVVVSAAQVAQGISQ
ncbi:MAG: hypothetical protein HOM68_20305 [Gemmatimonadetes bacterium]|jgi:hypothetical protein|nr:hypothetical protein [Gemmatimonadota bacterium]MBT5058897.1 hypothetical protein [Gemmatimonadota bacterium]MBT5144395.1 hypothetical protein [Gemmatimonadota bacterium]MBT5587087.1 hypothetical protein [Gemmatimonadota bacterium]MBT5960355.1 hypothetical protein [Gemmatimonadota bacterium]